MLLHMKLTIIHIQLESLAHYVTSQEESLAEQLDRFTKQVEEKAAQVPASDREEFYEWHSDDYQRLDDTFPTLFRISALTAIYGWYESTLNSLCDLARKDGRIALGVQDLHTREGIVARAIVYLEKLFGMTFPKNQPSWSNLRRYQEIRNCAVHNDRVISKKETKSWIKKSETAELDRLDRVRLKEGFLEQVLEDLNSVFRDLEPTLKTHWPTKPR